MTVDPRDVARFEASATADHDTQPEVWHESWRTWRWGRERGKDHCPICGVALGPVDR